LKEYGTSIGDPDEEPVFWLALASTQSKYGRLEPTVLDKALAVIDSGADLARWTTSPADKIKRGKILERVRLELTSQQKPVKRVAKRKIATNDWQVGELYAYRLRSERYIILRVTGHHTDRGGKTPKVELFRWVGIEIPGRLRLRFLPVLESNHPKNRIVDLLLLGLPEGSLDARLHRLEFKISPKNRLRGGAACFWKDFDSFLLENFGLE
jgi:hypothetical protein